MINAERPPLPTRHANPYLTDELAPTVKYQVLSCQGQDILVGRLKIPTPTANSTRSLSQQSQSGHAFILRRFDTDAISLTTMFRAAFPLASEDEEKREVNYIRTSYDLSGNNGSAKDTHITRLAGTWVSKSLAKSLAREYGLNALVDVVCDATPDNGANYRRSGKSTNNTSQTSVTASPAAQGIMASSSPLAKRSRKESPAPAPQLQPPSVHSSPAPKATPTPFAIAGATPSPSPRKSTRGTRSPAPPRASAIPTFTPPAKTPKKEKSIKPPSSSQPEHPSSPDTVVNPDVRTKDEGVDETVVLDVATDELHAQDIKEQQDLIAKLKAQRDNAATEEMSIQEPISKRGREEIEKGPRFEFKEFEEGEQVVKKEDRVVASNPRVRNRFQRLEPRQKSFAWGVAAFAVGMSAVHFLPDLVNQYLPQIL